MNLLSWVVAMNNQTDERSQVG